MEYSSFDFGTSSDGFKTDYVSVPDQQHTIDATADFFSFADASGDFEQLDTSATTGHSLQHQHQQHSDHTQKIDTPFHEPQLTPSGRDSSAFTGSSVLTGHNPEYAMSPLQISSRQTTMVNQQEGNVASNGLDSFGDEEEFFSPLESPAIAPTYDRNQSYTHISMQSSIGEATFSPLTSPALHAMPQHFMSGNHGNNFEQQSNNNSEQSPESILQQKLAMIERQQQQLRSAHWQLQGGVAVTSSGSSSSTSGGAIVSGAVTNATQESMQQIRPITNSPHLTATATNNASSQPFSQPLPRDTGFIAPATPSLLMKLGGGGGTAPNVSGNHSAVDNMASLPAAIIQDKSTIGSSSNTSTKKTAGPKRRKVSRSSAAFTSPGLVPTVHVSPRFPPTDPTIAALVSPAALRPYAPVSSSPRALKPLISPSLQPNGKRLSAIEEQEAVAALATKSNYQNMREGKAKSLGIDFSSSFQSGIENRRSAHKAAEQKRRDTLKQSFDALRKEIADAVTDTEDGNTNNNNNKDDAGSSEDSKEQKEKAVKQMSKVTLIQHAYEYIVRLKNENRRKDDEMAKLREEIQSLKSRLGDQPSTSTSTSTSSSSN